MQPVRVRRLGASDEAFVAELSRHAFAEFSRDPAATTLAMAGRHGGLLAERAGVPIGFAIVELRSGSASELLAIAVVEHERGRGVGRLLLDAVERAARRTGSTAITLHTAEANLAALELFDKRGYELERRLPRHYVGVFDAQKRRKRLQ
jgi:ribosomal protein S18 acetylase RimI-like enzyme